MPNFSSSGFAYIQNLSNCCISMTSQFHRKIFAVLVWQIIWSQSCHCLFWESISPCELLEIKIGGRASKLKKSELYISFVWRFMEYFGISWRFLEFFKDFFLLWQALGSEYLRSCFFWISIKYTWKSFRKKMQKFGFKVDWKYIPPKT